MLTPDALVLGPLVLAWERLALLLFLLAFSGLLPSKHTLAGILLGLLAARLGYGLLHLSDLGGLAGLSSLLDPRVGSLSPSIGAAVGASYLLLRGVRAPALARAGLGALALSLLPLLLVPAQKGHLSAGEHAVVSAAGPAGEASLPAQSAVVVSIWASWCGPCRAQMPLLLQAQQRGEPVVLLNAGESPEAVQAYLGRHLGEHLRQGFTPSSLLDTGRARAELRVSGLPTTLLLSPEGEVLARWLGPLDGAQLQRLLGQARQ